MPCVTRRSSRNCASMIFVIPSHRSRQRAESLCWWCGLFSDTKTWRQQNATRILEMIQSNALRTRLRKVSRDGLMEPPTTMLERSQRERVVRGRGCESRREPSIRGRRIGNDARHRPRNELVQKRGEVSQVLSEDAIGVDELRFLNYPRRLMRWSVRLSSRSLVQIQHFTRILLGCKST